MVRHYFHSYGKSVSLIHRLAIDEVLPVYVILRYARRQVAQTDDLIQQLSVSLEARATSSASLGLSPSDYGEVASTSGREELLWKENIDASQKHIWIPDNSPAGPAERPGHSLAYWKCSIRLGKRFDSLVAHVPSLILNRSTAKAASVTIDHFWRLGLPEVCASLDK